MNEIRELKNGLKVHLIQDSKFDEILVNIKLFFELESRTNTVANLLSKMMDDRTEKDNTKQAIQKRLDLMYGTRTGVQTYALGKYQVIDVSVKSIHSRFVNEDLIQEQLELLYEMVMTPLLTQATLNEAKSGLKLQFARLKESSSRYAQVRGFELSAPGQVFSLNTLGKAEDIDSIDLNEIKAFHQTLINSSSKLAYIVGDTEMPDVSLLDSLRSSAFTNPLLDTKIESRRVDEFHSGGQTELIMVYENDIRPGDVNYAAFLVYTAAFGQMSSSLLFQNVREKHSLAYSIYASRQIFDGIMFVATGINDENIDKVIGLVTEQQETLKKGEFDILPAIQYLVMSLEGNTEQLKSQADFVFRNDVLESHETIEMLQDQIRAVTIEDVRAISDHLKEPFIYAYRGKTDETN